MKKRDVPSSADCEGALGDIVYSDSEDWYDLNKSSEKQCSEVPVRPVNKFLRIGVAAKVKRESQGRHRKLFIGSQLQKENDANDHDASCEKVPDKHTWWEESCQVQAPLGKPQKRNSNPESLALTGAHGTFIGKRYENRRDEDISRNQTKDTEGHSISQIEKCPNRDLEEEYARIGKVDGLNVVAYRHQDKTSNCSGKKALSNGWGKNFVKLDIRVSSENLNYIDFGLSVLRDPHTCMLIVTGNSSRHRENQKTDIKKVSSAIDTFFGSTCRGWC